MTPEQYRILQARTRIGRAFGTGGSTWIPVTASGGTISTVPTFAVGALLTLYVLEAAMLRSAQSLPQVGIYTADWWGVGAASLTIASGVVLVSAADPTMAYLVDGAADTSQGAPLFPLKKVSPPALATVFAGYQAGLRIGAF
jgi:hypothetical protein